MNLLKRYEQEANMIEENNQDITIDTELQRYKDLIYKQKEIMLKFQKKFNQQEEEIKRLQSSKGKHQVKKIKDNIDQIVDSLSRKNENNNLQ